MRRLRTWTLEWRDGDVHISDPDHAPAVGSLPLKVIELEPMLDLLREIPSVVEGNCSTPNCPECAAKSQLQDLLREHRRSMVVDP